MHRAYKKARERRFVECAHLRKPRHHINKDILIFLVLILSDILVDGQLKPEEEQTVPFARSVGTGHWNAAGSVQALEGGVRLWPAG